MDDLRPAPGTESIPPGLWAISLVALAPFPLSALAYCYGPTAWAAPSMTTLLAWSAVTLAFLGGVRWGLETREPRPRVLRQGFSFLCAVAAVVILLSHGRAPDTWILGGFLVAFLIQWLFDHQTSDTPSRYPVLSTAVTGAAGVSLALALEKAMNG